MTVHVITMVPSHLPKDDLELKASPLIQELREALKGNGGEPVLPILLGDATLYSSQALEPYLGPFDSLVTKHASIKAYKKAKMSKAYKKATKENTKILTFGFTNKTMYIGWAYPALKKVYNMFQKKVDCESKVFVEAGGKVDYELYQSNGNSGMENYKRKVHNYPNQSFYMVNLITKDERSPDAQAADQTYSKGWLQAAFSYNVDLVLGGNIVSLDGGPKVFGEASIVKYPTRELYVDWLESDYVVELEKSGEASTLDRFVEICLPIY
jgi:hypothetical protein